MVLLPQKVIRRADITSVALLPGVSIDWDGLLDFVGQPAVYEAVSGGGGNTFTRYATRRIAGGVRQNLAVLRDLGRFIDFDKYVRCFTFGKTDIVPVRYDWEHKYLVQRLFVASAGNAVVKDASISIRRWVR